MNSIEEIVKVCVPIVVGIILFIQNHKIKNVQKAEIDKLTSDFARQSEQLKNVDIILSIYDVDKLKNYANHMIEFNNMKHEDFRLKIEKELIEKDLAERELLKFCIGAFNFVKPENIEKAAELQFPLNKKRILKYLNRLSL